MHAGRTVVADLAVAVCIQRLQSLIHLLFLHARSQLLTQLPKFIGVDVPAAIAVELVEKITYFRLDVTRWIFLGRSHV